jgi:hypothetical protein
MKLKILYVSLFWSFLSLAQSPNGITYQAVIRTGEDVIVANQNIGVNIKIRQGTFTGVVFYSEKHNVMSNTNGLITLLIGIGTTTDNFSDIDWSQGPYFVETSYDMQGGENYTISNTSQLLSVPYALYAENAGNTTAGPPGTPGEDGKSAYQAWLELGNTGTETEFLTTLTGLQGLQGTPGVVGTNGVDGTDGVNGTNGANGTDGQNGLSAYQTWLGLGNTGTETEFLTTLTGLQGLQGTPGAAGTNGVDGTDGVNGTDGQNGLSAYQTWLGLGNTGTEQDFIDALVGPEGTGSSSSEGYKIIKTIFNENITVGVNSEVTGYVIEINKNHLVVNFIPDYDQEHAIGLNIICFDENNNQLDVYVERFTYQRDLLYSSRIDNTKNTIVYYNATNFGIGFSTLQLNGSTNGGFAVFKVWANGIISKLSYTVNNKNSNSNYASIRNPNLKIYTYQ